MATVPAFAFILLVGVLVSKRAHRSVLSTAVLFLAGGFALGDGMLGAVHVDTATTLSAPSPSCLFPELLSRRQFRVSGGASVLVRALWCAGTGAARRAGQPLATCP